MITRNVLVSALFAAGTIAAVATPTASMAQLEFNLTFGPPAAIYEPIPAPRSGYVWQGGHWRWDGNRHVWNAGSWQASRPGYNYQSARWVENNGRWSYQASRWDRDGDGIPNNRDATPDGRNAYLNFGPPAARYERIPAPRKGYIWQAGHWNWDGNRHVWNAGNWQASRPGYNYHSAHWVENNGRWSYQASRWDRDGDGIANNRDATPDGVARSPDRDRDGVPDKRDQYPGNPNYR